MKSKIWLSSPHMGGSEQKYIQEAFDANWIAPLGPNVVEFEKELEAYFNDEIYAVALNSGTAAIHLGLKLIGVESSDEVLCQSFTFSASANPIIYLGAKPIFVDSEPYTWNMCPTALEEAIKDRLSKGKKPKAIVIVHLYGMPAKMDEIVATSIKYNIPILEDAAEALGAAYKEKKCGTFGHYGVLSFNGNKIITTSGGGALLVPKLKDKEKAIFWATQARDNAPFYQHSEIGYNYRLSNISAGIGRGQLEILEKRILEKRKIHEFYVEALRDIEAIKIMSEPNTDFYSNFWLTCLEIDDSKKGVDPEQLRISLLKDNIEARRLWKPLHLQPVFKDSIYYGGNCSETLFNKGLCLPSGTNMEEGDLDRIVKTIKSIFVRSQNF